MRCDALRCEVDVMGGGGGGGMRGGATPLWQEAAIVAVIVIRVALAIRTVCGWGVILAVITLMVCGWAVERKICGRLGGWFRPTQAPGILLGAVTLPLVMVARLAQTVRGGGGGEVGADRARVEFWTSVACSFALLVVLVLGRWEEQGIRVRVKGANRIWSVLVLLVGVVVVVQLGFMVAFRSVIWCVGVAAGSGFVFCYFLQLFPSCASAGEAMLVAHGFALYLGATVLNPLMKLVVETVWPESAPVEKVDPVLAIVHSVVLGMLLVPVLYRSLLSTLSLDELPEKEPVLESASRAALFCFTVLAVVVWAAPAWVRVAAGIGQHPVLWILRYVLDQPVQRLGLCVYWVVVIGVSSLVLHQMTLKKQMARIMIRKGFHIIVVVMFVPALAFQADFVRISFALALGVFILVESIRVWRIPPLGEKVQTFLKAFTDSRDSDALIISHFSLLLGCAIPIWLSAAVVNDRPLAAFAGILSLGVGDTMASVVGYNFGSLRLSRTSPKTWEGTVAGIVSIIGASILLSCMLPAFPLASQIGSMAIAALCAGLLEAFTSQLDNAFVPIVYYSLLSL